MRFAIDFPTSGQYCDPRLLAELAHVAEDSGWDGCFVWDHIQLEHAQPVADPWITLAAIALTTTRIRIGTLVTPLFRRNPWKLARETVTLDHLSKGRLILGVGSGSDVFGEISTFDGPRDDRIRAQMLDESLTVLTGLWAGEPFSFVGKYFRVNQALFTPAAFQTPRIPVWVAGTWPKKAPSRRAARYDGIVPVAGDFTHSISPAQLREIVEYIKPLEARNRFSTSFIWKILRARMGRAKQWPPIPPQEQPGGSTRSVPRNFLWTCCGTVFAPARRKG